MGLMNYFKTDVPSKTGPIHHVTSDNEKFARNAINTAQSFDPLRGTLAPQIGDQGFGGGAKPQPLSRSPSSRSGSRANSDDSRLVDEIKHQVVLNHLYQHSCSSLWIRDVSQQTEGVLVRKRRNEYLFKPPGLANSSFGQAMMALNVQAAMTVSSGVIEPFLNWSQHAVDVPLLNGLRVQILPTFDDLYNAKRHQYAAFISSEALLVVWDDEPTHLLTRAKSIEAELLKFVWKAANEGGEKDPFSDSEYEVDEETGLMANKERPILLYNAFMVSCSLCLSMVLLGLGWVKIADELVELHKFMSLLLLIMSPINFFLTLFFSGVVIGVFAQILGPIQHLTKNSKFFSATTSPRITSNLPHITIQCPVYKEGLESVIQPTVRSIKQAISTYELQGGSANIFINDDGLQIISAEERQARIEFYADNQIGWTARPGHKVNGFIRKGKFKKASNMNYGLSLSNSVEEALQEIDRPADWSSYDESIAYERCLKAVLDKEGRAWADGNIRIGDYILIIDSDTRVPEDCLLDAASEMEQSPRVAIIQFSSGVMQVAFNWFEDGVTFFTNLIYTAIRFGVASGDVAPFVGHNAILRWSAIQEVAFIDEDDGKEKFWSEAHVSEDFDIALRLQVYGYCVRMAAWAGDGFKEGVSLTVYDELTRWEKYAYGCNELVFHPVKHWPTKGIITPLFWRFLKSGMPFCSKINIISYIGTYYAIGATWVMTLANYIAVGFFNGFLDKWYVGSWEIWISIILVFTICGNVALAVQRHRTSEKSFFSAMLENFKWCLMFIIFFGGMSLHVSQALLCHMFSIDMSWGATAKEVEFSNFFIEIPKVAKTFKWSICMSLGMIGVIVFMAKAPFLPWSWNIDTFVAIFPIANLCVCHILLPIALNPGLMTFSW